MHSVDEVTATDSVPLPDSGTIAAETPSSGSRPERGEAARAGLDDSPFGNPERGLAVGISVASGDDSASPQYSEVGSAVRAIPLAVEPRADRVEDGSAVAVDAEFEPLAALDAHRRQAALASVVADARPGRDTRYSRRQSRQETFLSAYVSAPSQCGQVPTGMPAFEPGNREML
jgi:hypothetical protein